MRFGTPEAPQRGRRHDVSEDLADAAIEAKYTDSAHWRREAATVEASEWKGILATRGVLDTSRRDGAWAVPAAFVAYLVDT